MVKDLWEHLHVPDLGSRGNIRQMLTSWPMEFKVWKCLPFLLLTQILDFFPLSFSFKKKKRQMVGRDNFFLNHKSIFIVALFISLVILGK